jgi:amino acid transporter
MWDWIIMSLIYVCIATSLGEVASKYPVSGGVYYWSFMLSPPKHAALVSWIVGWLSVIGNVVVTLSVNFATTQLILSSVNCKLNRFESLSPVTDARSVLPGIHPTCMAHRPLLLGIVSHLVCPVRTCQQKPGSYCLEVSQF